MMKEPNGRDYSCNADLARLIERNRIAKQNPNQKALDYFRSKPFYFRQKERRKENGDSEL